MCCWSACSLEFRGESRRGYELSVLWLYDGKRRSKYIPCCNNDQAATGLCETISMELHDLIRDGITIRGEGLNQAVERGFKLWMQDTEGLLECDYTWPSLVYQRITREERIEILLIVLTNSRMDG